MHELENSDMKLWLVPCLNVNQCTKRDGEDEDKDVVTDKDVETDKDVVR